MTEYYIGIMFCLIMCLAYPAFRLEITTELEAKGIRTRDIRQKQKGVKNFWFYLELESAYGLGTYGKLLRKYPLVVVALTILHIAIGWLDLLNFLFLSAFTITALYVSAIILFTCIRRNRRLFGDAFVIWGKREHRNRKGMLLQKEYYSVIFDVVITVVPLAFPAMMWWFNKMKW